MMNCIGIHITAYRDRGAMERSLKMALAQTLTPAEIRIVDNSPTPLFSTSPSQGVAYCCSGSNLGTAGAINASIRYWQEHRAVDFIWILDQDSEPAPELLAELMNFFQRECKANADPIAAVAPLTRNRDNRQINHPMTFDRWRPRKVPLSGHGAGVAAELIPAAGMLIHLPTIRRCTLPTDRYFLDCYDFALGRAFIKIGARCLVATGIELSHQVGSTRTVKASGLSYKFDDAPPARIELRYRNETYLYTREAAGFDKSIATLSAFWRAACKSFFYLRLIKHIGWRKVIAPIKGYLLGLFSLAPSNRKTS